MWGTEDKLCNCVDNNSIHIIIHFQSQTLWSLISLYIFVPHYFLIGETLVTGRVELKFTARWDKEFKNHKTGTVPEIPGRMEPHSVSHIGLFTVPIT